MRRLTTLVTAALVVFGLPRPLQAALEDCGNGVIDDGEACDRGVGNQVGRDCTSICSIPRCGDGFLHQTEACDDGNREPGDGCSPECWLENTPSWQRTLDYDANIDERFVDAVVTDTHVFGLAHYAHVWNEWSSELVAFDRGGGIAWTETFGGSSDDRSMEALALLPDGTVLAVGHRPGADDEQRAWLARYDATGRQLSSELLPDPDVRALSAITVIDEHTVLLGGGRAAEPTTDAWIGRYDLDAATLQWGTTLSDISWGGQVYDLAVGPSGDAFAVGVLLYARFLARFDGDSGSLRWIDQNRGPAERSSVGSGVAIASDGSIYVAGTTDLDWADPDLGIDYDGWLTKFSPDGRELWSVFESGPLPLADALSSVQVLADDSVVVAGDMHTQPLLTHADWDRDALVVHYDADGQRLAEVKLDGPLRLADDATALTVSPEGGLVIAGSTHSAFEGTTAWVAELPVPQPGSSSSRMTSIEPPASLSTPASVAHDVHASDDAYEYGASALSSASERHDETLYINFLGAELTPGEHGPDAQVPCIDGPLAFPALGVDRVVAEAIVERVEAGLADYNVHVVWETPPPAHLPYTTVVVGGQPEQLGLPEKTAGFACVVDCGDRRRNELAFAFASDFTETLAGAILHEAGHTWGLDHVLDNSVIMAPFASGAARSFAGGCLEITDATSQPHCEAEHAKFCDGPGLQDARAELLARFGPPRIDVIPPILELEGAEDGMHLEPGEPLTLHVTTRDDSDNAGTRLSIPELGYRYVVPEASQALQLQLPPGRFTLRFEADDHHGNQAVHELHVNVGDARSPLADPLVDPMGKGGRSIDSAAGCSVGRERGPGLQSLTLMVLALVQLARRRRAERRARANPAVNDVGDRSAAPRTR